MQEHFVTNQNKLSRATIGMYMYSLNSKNVLSHYMHIKFKVIFFLHYECRLQLKFRDYIGFELVELNKCMQ